MYRLRLLVAVWRPRVRHAWYRVTLCSWHGHRWKFALNGCLYCGKRMM